MSVAHDGLWGRRGGVHEHHGERRRVTGRVLERPTREGESPVGEGRCAGCLRCPSTTGHEKPCGKQGGPPSKAKYVNATDSEPVP